MAYPYLYVPEKAAPIIILVSHLSLIRTIRTTRILPTIQTIYPKVNLMSNEENDDFENIVNNMGDSDTEEDDFDHVIDVVDHYWKAFHPGEIFIKGLLIVESTGPKGGRTLRYESSSPSSEWEVLGMLESIKQQFLANNVLEALTFPDTEDDEEDEDVDE